MRRLHNWQCVGILVAVIGGAGTLFAAQEPAAPKPAPAEKPKEPPKPLPDLSVDALEFVPTPVNRQRTRIRVRISNAGTVISPSTGLVVQCVVIEKGTARNCHGSQPPARFPVPRLRPGEARTFEVPLSRFLERDGKVHEYEIKALIDTSMRSAEVDRYNNSRQVRLKI